MGVGAARFGIRRTALFIEAGGTVEYIVVFEVKGECTCLAEIWFDEDLSDTSLAAGLLNRAWSVFRGNLVLKLYTILDDAVTSLRHM